MNEFSRLLLGAVSVVALTTSVFAADAIVEEPVAVAAGYNWSGLYVGAGIGVGTSVHGVGLDGPDTDLYLNGIGGDGVFGQVSIGYDYLVSPRFLIGAFADANLGNIGPELDLGGFNATIENEYGFNVGGRVGYLFNPSTLGYVTGGYSWQRFKLDTNADFDFEEDRSGYFVGAGMETVLGGAWTLKTEYRYAYYGDDTVLSVGGDEGGSLYVEPSTHTFMLGASYKLGAENGVATIEVPAYNWTGLYLGVAGGAGAAVTELSGGGASFDGLGGEGVLGEITAGYDHDFGGFVAGIQVGAHYGDMKSELNIGIGGPSINVDATADYGFDILARVGAKVNESTLAYVIGGYSWQNFEIDTDVGSDTFEWDVIGFSIGGGLETAVTSNMTVGFEYRYTQFEDADLFEGADVETSTQTARITAKYKFN